ncbi:hypothetical protein [Lacrimispora algidixylanolytica]|uniref:Uncharacterized protein n=1 Tax=Lacrimispora algidixylanolytica TaxID=94868 RepID=A0A419SYK9_9FIRM|nr:hypothetical protein [Lacrimispora algidixylanolytica]RKD30350.1 hypothetical protein BET01_07095 [Lacrimispora algidixylanolytica]
MESTIEQRVDVENVQQGSNWWSVLGFFIPLVGLILFLVWKTTNPKSAKAAGIGALVSVVLNLLVFVLLVVTTVMV